MARLSRTRSAIQYAVRGGVNELQRRNRVARYVKGSPDIGIIFAWQTALIRLTVQCDSGWDGERSKRKSVSVGNIRYGQHLLRHCHGLRRSRIVRCVQGNMAGHGNGQHDSRVGSASRCRGELQVNASAAIGISGRQGMGTVRQLDLSYLWLQEAVQGKQ